MSAKAKSLKEAGNTAFRQGHYENAILLYTEACQLDPSEYTYPLNRCMTYLKLNKLREAERDATKSLQLLPAGNPKAFFRRGLARKGLGKIDLARQDFEAALKEGPNNDAVKAELESLAKLKTSDRPSLPANPGPSKAAAEVPTKTQQPTASPDTPSSKTGAPSDRNNALKAAITPRSSTTSDDNLLSAVSTRRIKQSPVPSSTSEDQTKERLTSSVSTVDSAANGTKDFKSLRAARDQRFKASSPILSPNANTKPIPENATRLEAASSAESPSSVTLQNTLQSPSAPKNMYDFEKRWNDNRDTPSRAGMIAALVKQNIPLPVFFGSSLTPELLDEVLECLDVACRDYPDFRSPSIDFLAALPQCARFDFVSMLCANTHLVKSIMGGDARESQILSVWGAV